MGTCTCLPSRAYCEHFFENEVPTAVFLGTDFHLSNRQFNYLCIFVQTCGISAMSQMSFVNAFFLQLFDSRSLFFDGSRIDLWSKEVHWFYLLANPGLQDFGDHSLQAQELLRSLQSSQGDLSSDRCPRHIDQSEPPVRGYPWGVSHLTQRMSSWPNQSWHIFNTDWVRHPGHRKRARRISGCLDGASNSAGGRVDVG